jgi:transposase
MQSEHADLAEMLASMPELQALLMAEREAAKKEREAASQRISNLEKERDNLRASHERLRLELELFKHRLFIAKAERAPDAPQLQLEFEEKLRQLDEMAGTLGMAKEPEREQSNEPARDGKPRGKRTGNRGTGRRDLRELALDEVRIEIADPHLEKFVAEGKVKRHGFEETCKLGHRRASKVRIVVARVRYKTEDAQGNTDVITTSMPNEMLPSSIVAPSFAANMLMANIGMGTPLFRLEDALTRDGVRVDRGTLSRVKKQIGDALLATVVKAMLGHARENAFCISTDATGVCVQPIYSHEKGSQPCKKGNFLVVPREGEWAGHLRTLPRLFRATFRPTLRLSSTCSLPTPPS